MAGLVLVVAACGGDDDTVSRTTAAPSATTSASPTVAETLPPEDPGPDAGQDRSGELQGRWEIINYVLPDGGGITNVVGDAPVFIELNADGSVDYNTGCNAGSTVLVTSGTYYVPESALDDEAEGQPITFGPAFEQTERGCDGFLGDQDRDLPDDMGAATRFILDGDRLLLLDEFLLIEATKSG
ncbi:MAG: META domain-containing protein [Actinomycetia bacterium]|nr:META domain-containing protein [bacterium]MCP4960914.1 META domain-containing protein [Actinomycetes bacterium]